ncbi:MAG: STAS domain-containing protein [Thermodesulfovibrionales bacterium]|jgi:ABC-type transporter Mla MlaB component|nr:STAS domain-containing protein [Thermodesulfovibrionales bacterium]
MSTLITFNDELTIDELYKNVSTLRDAFLKWDEVKVDITNVRKIDTAAIQMLIAAEKECQECGKSLSFMTSGEVDRILSLIGIQL